MVRYDTLTGRFDGVALGADSGLSAGSGLVIAPGNEGMLFVSSRANDRIVRYRFVLQEERKSAKEPTTRQLE